MRVGVLRGEARSRVRTKRGVLKRTFMIKWGAPPPEPTKACVRKLIIRLGIQFVCSEGPHMAGPRCEWVQRSRRALQRTHSPGYTVLFAQQETQSSHTWPVEGPA